MAYFDYRSGTDSLTYKPVILNLTRQNDADYFNELIENADIQIADTLIQQITELIAIRRVGKAMTQTLVQEETKSLLGDLGLHEFGNWVYYPWSRQIVHVLEEPLFAEIRTSRNQLKITAEEQAVLQKKKVGIVGLSVGSAIAMTMAMERSAGELVLADFDTIDLSNLNRVRGKISQIGVNKAVLMAREIAEMDPYLKITVFDEGVTEANLDAFFDQKRPLDLLIDECDSLPVKIQLRLAAKQRGIPVLMETSDRGMLDVERFDLEAGRPLFHGRLSDFDLLNLSDIDPATRMGMLMALVDFDNISPRLKQSYAELGKTLNTWPQLASAVTLGGGSCADVARRVLMQEDVQSGRYYVDMQQILSKPAN